MGFSSRRTSLSVPKIGSSRRGGSGGNALMNMMYAQSLLPVKENMKNVAELEKQSASVAQVPEQVNQLSGTMGAMKPGAQVVREGITNPVNREYTMDESKNLGGTDMLLAHIGEIERAMDDAWFPASYMKATARLGRSQEKGQILGIPLSLGDEKAGKLKFAINDLSNRLLYLRSGAQINENEFTRLASALPSLTHILSDFDFGNMNFKGKYSELKNMLNAYKQDAMQIKQRLIEGGRFDDDFWSAPVPDDFIKNPKLHIYGSLAKRQDDLENAVMPGQQSVTPPVQNNQPVAAPPQQQQEDPFEKYYQA